MNIKTCSASLLLLTWALAAVHALAQPLIPEPPRSERMIHHYDWIYFNQAGLGYVASEKSLIRTRDGGQTWTPILENPVGGMGRVFRLNDSTLYMWAPKYRLYRTTNQGDTWEELASRVRAMDRNASVPVDPGFFFLDENRGWGTTVDQFVRTQDGGVTWRGGVRPVRDRRTPTRLWMFDENEGIGIGAERVQRTTNGGLKWTEVPGSPRDLSNVGCLPSGFCIGYTSIVKTYVTHDKGLTWATVPTGVSDGQARALQVRASDDAAIVGNDWSHRSTTYEGALLLRWNGTSWIRTVSDSIGGFNGVHFVTSTDVWATAEDNGIVHSTDGGQTWTFVPDYYRQVAALTPTRTPWYVIVTPTPE